MYLVHEVHGVLVRVVRLGARDDPDSGQGSVSIGICSVIILVTEALSFCQIWS